MEFRQLNLDFHTSEAIEGIGKAFNKQQFQKCLKMGHISSVNLFAKCHHGWSYHPTKVGDMHPHLDFDLLGSQIEAAREIGVKTPIYFSSGFDERSAALHPEWVSKIYGQKAITEPAWKFMCVNTEYLDYLCKQIAETLSVYKADGVFVDISAPRPCVCETCKKKLLEMGKNPENSADVWEFANIVYADFAAKIRATIDKINPELGLFFNAGHVFRGRRDISFGNTHLEIESLPTGGWGYDDFPVSAAYARTLGMEYLGMTGKFHLSWGEFGGFKHYNALRYEVSMFGANGAKFCVGDQLHPSGKMDEATYDIIGRAYAEAEEKEPWIDGAENIAEIGVLSVEAVENYYHGIKSDPIRHNNSDYGCVRILNEGHYLYNFVDVYEDFSKYKLLILPDKVETDEFIKGKIKEAVKCGTKILATGKSGTFNGKLSFDFGCEFCGRNEFNPTYIKPDFPVKSFKNTSFVIYSPSYVTKITDGTELAICENPYFNRTVEHFCSHMHAPSNGEKACCGISEGKDGIYIAWELFNEYAEMGSLIGKEIIHSIIDRMLEKTVETNLPQQGILTMTSQNDRVIVHLLYAAAVKRGNVEVIEETLPVLNTKVKVKNGFEPQKVYLAPQNKEIDFVFKDGYTEFTVDCFECHQMVVMEK